METAEWHALYVSSRAEKKAGELLSAKGIRCYVPLVKTWRQWSDRKKLVELPLLNGYVFVYNDSRQNEQILQTKGVVSFVKSEGKIARVREEEIERMKQLIALGYSLEVGAARYDHPVGSKVKVLSGALKNIEGFVVENKEGRYIEVLLESIGQSIRAKLPEGVLIPVN